MTDPTVISPLKNERPETWTEAAAFVVVFPAEPETVDETEPAVAIDPSPGNAKLPPPEPFPETPPPVAPPRPGAETWIPNALAVGVPALVADGAPVEPVSARTDTTPSSSDWRLTTSPGYWRPPTSANRSRVESRIGNVGNASVLLARLRSEPEQAAVLLDIDGTLAPIVERPEDAAVPEETRAEVERLAGRTASSPASAAARGRRTPPGRRRRRSSTSASTGSRLIRKPGASRSSSRPSANGSRGPGRSRTKAGVTLAFHYREAADEAEARRRADQVAAAAESAGLTRAPRAEGARGETAGRR